MGRSRLTAGTLFLALAVCLVSVSAQSAAEAESDGALTIDDAHSAVEQWVETRRVISLEKRDWALGREVLGERIELVQQEIASLRARIAEAQEDITDADEKRAELVEENERLKVAASTLGGSVKLFESRTRDLLPRLPDPLRAHVKPLSQRLPDDPETTELSLGERFQNVVGVLNEVNKFNREISLTSEVRTLGDGSSAEVTALYLGVGQAYYVSAGGEAAGVGSASEEAWVWRPADEAAPQIAQAIAVLNNEQEAVFVQLPIRIE